MLESGTYGVASTWQFGMVEKLKLWHFIIQVRVTIIINQWNGEEIGDLGESNSNRDHLC